MALKAWTRRLAGLSLMLGLAGCNYITGSFVTTERP